MSFQKKITEQTEQEQIVYQALKESRHFKNVEEDVIQRFMPITKYRYFQDKEAIIHQGAINRDVYIIINGKASVHVDENFLYMIQRKGDVIGEVGIITGKPATATIEAAGYLESIQITTSFLDEHSDETFQELHYLIYRWFSRVLADKLYLTSQKAKLYAKAEKMIAQKNQELESNIEELKTAYHELQHTRVELEESKKVTALTQIFQKFVPAQYIERVSKEGVENIEVGHAVDGFVTVLFSDIRAFTTISEKMSPKEVFQFLSAYLKRMSESIHTQGGFIDKFIGDAIMAVFSHPDGTHAEEAQCAINASLGFQRTLKIYNRYRRQIGHPPLQIGVGIHSGFAMMGTVGSETRMDFTVIGDSVNLASRLENLTKYYKVSCIISQETYKLLDISPYKIRELDTVQVKGKTEKVVIFEVFSGDPVALLAKKVEILPPYNLGLIHFQIQEWEESIALFQECLEILPEDRPSQLYLERCKHFQKNPPGEDWDHVFKLDK